MEVNAQGDVDRGSILTKEDIGFDVKVTWLAISRLFNPLAAAYGMTVTMGFVLLNISHENGTPATKIAEDGLIERRPDLEDRRSVRIFLTPSGFEKRKVARRNVETFNLDVRKTVKEHELNTFFEVMEKIHHVINDNLK